MADFALSDDILYGTSADGDPEAHRSNTAARILAVGPNDDLCITWGAAVSQKAGTQLHQFEAIDNSHMLLFVNRGGLKARIGEETLAVSKGQALLVWPGEICVGVEPHETEFLCQWLSFAVERSRGRSVKRGIHVPRVANASDPGLASEIFRLLIEEYHKHQSKGQTGIPLRSEGPHHLLMSLLARLNPDRPEELQPSNAPAVLADRARNLMRADPGGITSIVELASMLDCSVGYMRLAFRSTYHCSPLAYLRRFRMLEARRLLLQTSLSCSDIARQCGYTNPSHFARVFRREHGVNPAQYRIAHSQQYRTPGI